MNSLCNRLFILASRRHQRFALLESLVFLSKGASKQGPRLNIETVCQGMVIPMMKIRRPQCRFIFNMGILILVRRYLYTQMVTRIAFPMLWGIHSADYLHHSDVVAFVLGVVWIQAPLGYLIRTVQYLPLRFFLCIIISCVQFKLFWTSNPICRRTSWSNCFV